MKRVLLSAALTLLWVATASASTDTWIFRDIRSPTHPRSQATKMADGRACGVRNGEFQPAKAKAVLDCLSTYGWVLARIEHAAAPSARPAYTGPDVSASVGDDGQSAEDEATAQEEENDQFAAQQAAASQDEQDAIDAADAANAAAAQQSFDQTEEALGQQ